MRIANGLFVLTFSAALIGLIGAAAEARVRRQHQNDDPEPMYSGRNVVVCQKMCPQDFSPCDPLYFKTADGRCAGIRTR
jgi:hypothetical protein